MTQERDKRGERVGLLARVQLENLQLGVVVSQLRGKQVSPRLGPAAHASHLQQKLLPIRARVALDQVLHELVRRSRSAA